MRALMRASALPVMLAAATALGTTLHAQSANRDPDRARFVTSDLAHFWEAFDARTQLGTARALDSLYFKRATPGLEDFRRLRLQDANSVARTVDAAASYYASTRASMARLSEFEAPLRAMMHRFYALYPAAVFPDVYFVVGRLSTGGTTGPAGLLIGAEMYGRTSDAFLGPPLNNWHRAVLRPVEDLSAIVSHELMHYQQQRIGSSLLAVSLYEGIADFVAELVSGENLNYTAVAYLDAHADALRAEFLEASDERDLTEWLYNGAASSERPADLGYAVGHHIARAFYQRATDKPAALRRMLTLTNERQARQFLEESGWAK